MISLYFSIHFLAETHQAVGSVSFLLSLADISTAKSLASGDYSLSMIRTNRTRITGINQYHVG